ncbi:hypothetical protein K474DRAFT_1321668 [Panus rudis PR-1116 ss-1]|nr:hypothetical protein K474DRAFT_1321668 [Panus rudis PR-1116 ss-1]
MHHSCSQSLDACTLLSVPPVCPLRLKIECRHTLRTTGVVCTTRQLFLCLVLPLIVSVNLLSDRGLSFGHVHVLVLPPRQRIVSIRRNIDQSVGD